MKLNSLLIDFRSHFQAVLIAFKALAKSIFEANFPDITET